MSSITCPNTACGAVLEGSDLRHCPRCGGFLPLAAAEDPADPLVGQPILNGKYRVISIIGEGGMGKVYLAEQKLGQAHRKVAIKTLQPDLAQDPQIIARFHRETQTVIELEHPNTIKFYDFGELEDHGKKLFVVMEFIQGESLAQVLSRGPLEVPRAERIMAQICGSLQEAHDHGIVHRDLKPENIYLTQKGARGDFVKVLDFGIAKRDEPADAKDAKLTRQGMVLGTPPYMSPEQFTGQALDGRSDIYALGVMSYEMLTGALPFTASTPWEWATKHLTAQPTPFEQQPNGGRVPPQHRAAILRSLQKNRDDRQPSVTQFLQEFSGNSEGATDWTASSTSMPGSHTSRPNTQPGAPRALGTNPTVQSTGPYGPGPMNTPNPNGGFIPGTAAHPYPTPNPFAGPGSAPGFVPSPSSAGFAAVPPTVAPGMAGSNPGFNPLSGQQQMYGGMAPAPPKSKTGLFVGIFAVLCVLGVGGWAVNYYVLGDDDDAPQPQAQAPSNVPNNPQGPAGPTGPNTQPPIPTPQVPVNPQPQIIATNPNANPPANPPVNNPPANNPPATNPNTQPTNPPANTHTAPADRSDPRATAAANRGMTALGSNDFSGAISALQEGARFDSGATGVGRLRAELRRRGHNRIDNLILGGNCGAAQSLFRQLRSAGAAPSTGSFADACPAP